MRRTQIICAIIVLSLGFVFTLPAQDSIVIVTAEGQGLNLVSSSDLPDSGTFWLVSSNGVTAPLPCPPPDASLPVFQITGSEFLVDATGGLVATEPDQSVEDAMAAMANDLQNLINKIQGVTPSRNLSRGGAHAMDDPDPNDPDNGDGDTNDYNPSDFAASLHFTTNQLWLQIVAKTNTTAYLWIHPPWNVTNGVYDLLFTTNLALPIQWQWVLRTDPGQTNLVVSNAVDGLGFYALGKPNDLLANDSLGTNFWLAFMYMDSEYDEHLSLSISSQVGASGTINIPGLFTNDPVMVASNCGNAAVNGKYILTNLTAQEQLDWQGYGWDTNRPTYVNTSNGTNWVNSSGDTWYMFGYDPANPGADNFATEYAKHGNNLNGSAADWQFDNQNPISPTPTTTCVQHPFTKSFTVAAGALTNLAVDTSLIIFSNDVVGTNGIQIITSQPVSVYGFDYDSAASAAFTCYPTPLLGTNYCLMARPALKDGLSEFAVVATVSNTTVTIMPSATANLDGHLWTNPIVLQPGQTYQIVSQENYETNDVTGTLIKSDKPIGVFAGASLGFVPDNNTDAGNPLVQEQLPVETWGTQALSIGFAGRTNGDSYRIVAAYSNTVVTVTGLIITSVDETVGPPWSVTASNETVSVTLTNAGQFYDIIVGGPVEFQASQPIQVAHFANGNDFDGATNNPNGYQEGDPCEVLLPPAGHYLETNIVATGPGLDFSTYPPGGFDENFLNLIVLQSAISTTSVDGVTVAATNFVPIGMTGYCGAQFTVTNGVHIVISSQPVGVEVYGFGYYDSYSYFGGVVK
jgi:hypothetical protein